jgi:hypothetical protein
MSLSDLFNNPEAKITGPYDGLASGADTARFPALYSLTDALTDARMADVPTDALILGVDGTGAPITMDLAADNPHLMVSAGTGGGKSTILRAMAVQALLRGWRVIILDSKRHSHMWAEKLPNVLMARNIGEIANALSLVGQDVNNRNHIAEQWIRAQHEMGNWDVDIADAPIGPRTIVLYEEMNTTHSEVVAMTKEKFRNSNDYTAIQGFKDVTNLGRAAKYHVMAVGQYMSGSSMGKNSTEGAAVRANFSTRVLINHDANAWNMLARECGFPHSSPSERGRGYLCRNGKARMTQFVYVSERDAHHMVKDALPRELVAAPAPSLP